MKIVQISIEVNSNSVGKIAEQIGEQILAHNGESYITYARNHNPSKSEVIKIGNKFDLYYHGLQTRLFDTHCLHSKKSTTKLISQIEQINPDIVHLHHIHGYFLNMKILFEFLKRKNYPVVWTFHDCWSFTGHCAYFDSVNCQKWKTECNNCELKKSYPASYIFDRSQENFKEKKALFTSINNLTIVPVSDWLARLVEESFLKGKTIKVIKNGIDTSLFRPLDEISISNILQHEKRKILLGVASIWDERKGLNDFLELDKRINHEEYCIVLVGLNSDQIKKIPTTILGFHKTESIQDLVSFFNRAYIFINPTRADTYPTTNLEAISCGVPVITYNTGGSPESITEFTGIVTTENNVVSILESIKIIDENKFDQFSKEEIRNYAVEYFNKQKQFNQYIILYNELMNLTN